MGWCDSSILCHDLGSSGARGWLGDRGCRAVFVCRALLNLFSAHGIASAVYQAVGLHL